MPRVDLFRVELSFHKDVDYEELLRLYREAGFERRVTAEEYRRAVAVSQFFVTARVGSRIVGAGRALSDGVMYMAIFDVVVHPDFQRNGIGRLILETLVRKLPNAMIMLTSTAGNEGFYEKLGFLRHKAAFMKYPLDRLLLMREQGLDGVYVDIPEDIEKQG